MEVLTKIAERKIQEAIDNGELENLPSKGRPLVFEDFSNVPQHLRMAYKVLKNADIAPVEVQLKKESAKLREELNKCNDDTARKKLQQKINDNELHYNLLLDRMRQRKAHK